MRALALALLLTSAAAGLAHAQQDRATQQRLERNRQSYEQYKRDQQDARDRFYEDRRRAEDERDRFYEDRRRAEDAPATSPETEPLPEQPSAHER